MHISPVSFGTLFVCHIKDGQAHVPIPDLVKLAFDKNPKLKEFSLKSPVEYSEVIDGTTYNANKKCAQMLDKNYYKQLPKKSNDVILTSVKAEINPQKETETRYFLTASSEKKEKEIHNYLSQSNLFYVGKFNYRKN